jgi:O-antigen ligase
MFKNKLETLEFVFLSLLIIFLPSLEGPKNLFWGLFIITSLIRQYSESNLFKWRFWDYIFLAWVLSGILVAVFAGLPGHSEWSGANDIFRYTSIAWLIYRNNYTEQQIKTLLLTLVGSTLIALPWSYWTLFISGTKKYLELKSVGHVNHSSIYLAIMFGLTLSGVLAAKNDTKNSLKFALGISAFVFLISIVIGASRASLGAITALILILPIFYFRSNQKVSLIVIGLSFTALLIATAIKPTVILRLVDIFITDNPLSYRDIIWKAGFEGWQQFPLFGVGINNYKQINESVLQAWHTAAGTSFDVSLYAFVGHGHSLYMTALAERGLIGLSTLVIILLIWLLMLMKLRPQKIHNSTYLWAWGASLSAWLVTTGVGLVNTTLHHEHGILTCICLGLWLNRVKFNHKS